jgi:hypothetical protein
VAINTGRSRMQVPLLTTALILLLCVCGGAQQNQSGTLPDAPSAGTQAQPPAPQAANPVQSSVVFIELLQQKSLMFPDLATNQGPLDSWGKFKLAANNSVALSTIGAALISSAYGQAINSPAGYGQGGEGFGKRFGADMARAASANIFGTFMIASLTHEDPRFYVKKHLNFKESVKYAAVRLVITRSDSGERTVSYSDLLGPLAGEALANTYYPAGSRGVGSTLTRYASDLGWKFAGNLFRQYWPTINRRLRLAPEPAPASPSGS